MIISLCVMNITNNSYWYCEAIKTVNIKIGIFKNGNFHLHNHLLIVTKFTGSGVENAHS